MSIEFDERGNIIRKIGGDVESSDGVRINRFGLPDDVLDLFDSLPFDLEIPRDFLFGSKLKKVITKVDIEKIYRRLRIGGHLSIILKLLRIPEDVFVELLAYGRVKDCVWTVVDLIVTYGFDEPITSCLEVIHESIRDGRNLNSVAWMLRDYYGVANGGDRAPENVTVVKKDKDESGYMDDLTRRALNIKTSGGNKALESRVDAIVDEKMNSGGIQ